jgi:hypothetical protein
MINEQKKTIRSGLFMADRKSTVFQNPVVFYGENPYFYVLKQRTKHGKIIVGRSRNQPGRPKNEGAADYN